MHLALDDHRVDHRAAVVHHAVAQDLDLGRLRVGLDDRRVHAVGEGRADRRVPAGRLEPGLLAVGHRRPVGRGRRGELGGPLAPPRRRRTAAGWTARRPWPGRSAARRREAPHRDLTVVDRRGRSRSAASAAAAMRSAFARTLRAASATALPLITAAREANVPTPYLNRRVSPVVTVTRVDRHAELLGGDLGEHRLVPLALGGQAGGDHDLAGGLDPHVRALVRARRRCPPHRSRGRCRPAVPRARACSRTGSNAAQSTSVQRLVQRRREVAGVVDERPSVLEHQALVVRHLVGLDHVALAHHGAVESDSASAIASMTRSITKQPCTRPAPRYGVTMHRVRVERMELDPVDARLVRPEQLGRGDDRHDDAVRRVGAVVVQEPHVEAEHAALVVEADPHRVLLRPLVGRGDEVLAAVLDPLDLAAAAGSPPTARAPPPATGA